MSTHNFLRRLWPARNLTRQSSLPGPLSAAALPLEQTPLMVFDLETTGLNQRKDQVISIGAVKILPAGIPLDSAFYELLNIPLDPRHHAGQLIHGLTQQDLLQGQSPEQALTQFLNYAQHHLWFAFHAEFDRHMLMRAVQQHLGLHFDPQPLDIAELAPLLNPGLPELKQLDDWLGYFGLDSSARHNAVGDALASAELLSILKQQALQAGFTSWAAVQQAAQQHKKLDKQQQNAALLMF